MKLRDLCTSLYLPIPNPHCRAIQDAPPQVASMAQHMGGSARQLSLPNLALLPAVIADAVGPYRDALARSERIRETCRRLPPNEADEAIAAAQDAVEAAWVALATVLIEQRSDIDAWVSAEKGSAIDRLNTAAKEFQEAAASYSVAAALQSALTVNNLSFRPNTVAGIIALNAALYGSDPMDPRDGVTYALTQLDK